MGRSFKQQILQGIPDKLPKPRPRDEFANHAPVRRQVLDDNEKVLAVKNALRYFPKEHHKILAPEFARELAEFGHIYAYRFRPTYEMHGRPFDAYPSQSEQAASMMIMIQNNLDPEVSQHPHELITYGGNGSVFSNWAQYLQTMKYLATMTDRQTLHMSSGHPMGLFPSSPNAPRAVIVNGMMVPDYSKPIDYEKGYALGVTLYGQMTAGSWMYIGSQGIVHGTYITILNAFRQMGVDPAGRLFVSSGLGGMSGAQPKAAKIAGAVSVIAEINPKAVAKQKSKGWVDEVYSDLRQLTKRIRSAQANKEAVSLAYQGNIVDLWEWLDRVAMRVDLGSDQTSLHNPYAGGYYPAGMSLEDAQSMMASDPKRYKEKVQESLRRHVAVINRLAAKGMHFFDYGNAFLLEAGRAKADIFKEDRKTFRYPSYVEDIMGPLCFDYGFGPFRWVCTSGKKSDLDLTDQLAGDVLEKMAAYAPEEIHQQLEDNLHWVREAGKNKLVMGTQARILYSNAEGRIAIAALAFNKAIREGKIKAPIVLGRDHHDVSGTDSPFRETANIYDGSRYTADMAVQNVIGDAFRGATWVSLHNGGGVGWGQVINGGFGMVLDGSRACDKRIRSMMFWDVMNGITRRARAGNEGAIWTLERAMEKEPLLQVEKAHFADDDLVRRSLEMN